MSARGVSISHQREVRERMAAAWDEGYSHLFDSECTDVDPVSLHDNPYRVTSPGGSDA